MHNRLTGECELSISRATARKSHCAVEKALRLSGRCIARKRDAFTLGNCERSISYMAERNRHKKSPFPKLGQTRLGQPRSEMEICAVAAWEAFQSLRADFNPQSHFEILFTTIVALLISLGYSLVSTTRLGEHMSRTILTNETNHSAAVIETLDLICYWIVDENENRTGEIPPVDYYYFVFLLASDNPLSNFLHGSTTTKKLKDHLEHWELSGVQLLMEKLAPGFRNFFQPQSFKRRFSPPPPPLPPALQQQLVETMHRFRLEPLEILSKLSIPDLWKMRQVCTEWYEICSIFLEQSGPWVILCARDSNTAEYHEEVWCPRTGLSFPMRVPSPKYLHRVVASSGGLVCAELIFCWKSQERQCTQGLALVVGNPITNKWKEIPRLAFQNCDTMSAVGYTWDVRMTTGNDGTFRIVAVSLLSSARCWQTYRSTYPLVYDSRVGEWKMLVTAVADVYDDCADWESKQVGTLKDAQAPVFLTDFDWNTVAAAAVVFVIDRQFCWKIGLPEVDEDFFVPLTEPLEPPQPSNSNCDHGLNGCFCKHEGLFYWQTTGLRDEESGRILLISAVREKVYVRGFVIYELREDRSVTILSRVRSEELFGEALVFRPAPTIFSFKPFQFFLQGGFLVVTTEYRSVTHGVWRPLAYGLEADRWSIVGNVEPGVDYDGVCVFMPKLLHKNEQHLEEETGPLVLKTILNYGDDHFGQFLEDD